MHKCIICKYTKCVRKVNHEVKLSLIEMNWYYHILRVHFASISSESDIFMAKGSSKLKLKFKTIKLQC